VDATPRDLAVLRSIRDAGPYRDAEIHVTAWNSSPSSRDFTHDYLQAATFIVRTNLHSLGLVDSLVYRGLSDFTEEQGAGTEMFHGGCGMLTVQGIAKPAWHAYRFLHFLGDELLARTDGAVVTRRSEDGLLRALIYHYPEETAESVPASYGDRRTADETIGLGAATWVELDVSGLRAGARVVLETVDRVHGNAMTVWDELRRPAYPTREQTAVIRDRAACGRLETATVGADGYLRLDRAIDAWTILSVREEPT
jgi:xylan 1,4-beta-xylosidase